MRVLVVEDSERLQRYMCDGLRSAGYAVDEAADGEEVLWMAETDRYDVIVLDRMLPRGDAPSRPRPVSVGISHRPTC